MKTVKTDVTRHKHGSTTTIAYMVYIRKAPSEESLKGALGNQPVNGLANRLDVRARHLMKGKHFLGSNMRLVRKLNDIFIDYKRVKLAINNMGWFVQALNITPGCLVNNTGLKRGNIRVNRTTIDLEGRRGKPRSFGNFC